MNMLLQEMINKIICGDCLEVMKGMPSNSVDTVITDPPYALGFMGKAWDKFPSDIGPKKPFANQSREGKLGGRPFQQWTEKWATEALRVAKPGATLLCFGGTRTYHRLACAIEDAGWILKDCIMWIYGSGFPKATDISKQLDKRNGRKIEHYQALGKYLKKQRGKKSQKEISKLFPSKTGGLTGCVANWELGLNVPTKKQWNILKEKLNLDNRFDEIINRVEAEREKLGIKTKRTKQNWCPTSKDNNTYITKPQTEEAKLWNGWKSHGLKPAYEPILVAMKPNEGSYANNALKHGVAGLNIDGGRIKTNENLSVERTGDKKLDTRKQGWGFKAVSRGSQGRFPANIILDQEAAKMLDEQSGVRKSTFDRKSYEGLGGTSTFVKTQVDRVQRGDKGGASRFFYVAKASKAERNAGCEGLEEKEAPGSGRSKPAEGRKNALGEPRANHHPTVKPLTLMEYLCILTKTPTGGILLDPFAGSGTTGLACQRMGRKYILIEKEPEYCKIAKARLSQGVQKNLL